MIDDETLLGWEIAVEEGYGQTNPRVLRDWLRSVIAEVRAQRDRIERAEADRVILVEFIRAVILTKVGEK
jgi:hypothetical protein